MHGANTESVGHSLDLSSCGLRINCDSHVEPGTRVEVEIEVFMPTQLRLGYDVDSLLIDGPPMSHFARFEALVRRCDCRSDREHQLGVEFVDVEDDESARVVDAFIELLEGGAQVNRFEA